MICPQTKKFNKGTKNAFCVSIKTAAETCKNEKLGGVRPSEQGITGTSIYDPRTTFCSLGQGCCVPSKAHVSLEKFLWGGEGLCVAL